MPHSILYLQGTAQNRESRSYSRARDRKTASVAEKRSVWHYVVPTMTLTSYSTPFMMKFHAFMLEGSMSSGSSGVCSGVDSLEENTVNSQLDCNIDIAHPVPAISALKPCALCDSLPSYLMSIRRQRQRGAWLKYAIIGIQLVPMTSLIHST